MLREIAVQPMTGHIGAEIRQMPLRQCEDPEVADTLRQLLNRYELLVFREQFLSLEEQKQLTRCFGPIQVVPYVEPSSQDPEVVAVLKEADETSISVFGGDWHSDFSFLEQPPAGSVLTAMEVPPAGGDTLWTSQTAAWNHLAPDLKARLGGRRAIHTGAPYGLEEAPEDTSGLSRSIRITRGAVEADRPVAHPIVRRHPETGKAALFVNPIYTRAIEGMLEEESRPLLQELFRHATRPDFGCRHRWQAGDVVIWDNRVTLHYATNDYDGHRRLLYRTTFGGERPESFRQ